MSEKNDAQLEYDLTEALADGDVAAALDELSRRYAGDAGAVERIETARSLVGELVSMGEDVTARPVPPMSKLELPPARFAWWKWVAPAAAVVAAAVVLAVLLNPPPIAPHVPEVVSPPQVDAQQPTLPWRVPSVAPITLPDETFTVPNISIPSTSSPDIGWTVPSVTFDFSDRRKDNDKQEIDSGAERRNPGGPVDRLCRRAGEEFIQPSRA